jgi:hypothetical protein
MCFVLARSPLDMARDSDIKHPPLAGHYVNVVGLLHVKYDLRSERFLSVSHVTSFACGFPNVGLCQGLPSVIVIPNLLSEGMQERDLTRRVQLLERSQDAQKAAGSRCPEYDRGDLYAS